jgi:hypothetical protein
MSIRDMTGDRADILSVEEGRARERGDEDPGATVALETLKELEKRHGVIF